MSQPDDRFDKLRTMRYFTPDLVLRLNSSQPELIDSAMAEWERAVLAYRKGLRAVRREMPSQSRVITELSLHDWNLVDIKWNTSGSVHFAFILLEHDKDIAVLCYALAQNLRRIDSPKEWSLSKRHVHWLYDEVDVSDGDHESFLHRILFSDGTILLVPFSSCEVTRVKLDHVMSHSDMLQVA